MSIRIMSMVFDRYPVGGGEMLLALALADHAHDDGTNIYPSVNHLSSKTRQSERTVQYQLRKMEECGWLVLVADEKGGRGKAREYRINIEWIKGAEIAPIIKGATDNIKGATDNIKGATDNIKGATDNIKGAIAVAPESSITIINHHRTVIEPSLRKKSDPHNLLFDVTEQTQADFKKLRLAKKAPITERAISAIRSEATKAGIDLETALIECCARGWTGFKAEWYLKGNEVNAHLNKADKLLQRNRVATQNWRPPEMRGEE